jgi:hypothetical protein
MRLEEHHKALGRIQARLRNERKKSLERVEKAKIRTESLKTPKGDFHLWLSSLILLSDKIWNRKLWRDYHK